MKLATYSSEAVGAGKRIGVLTGPKVIDLAAAAAAAGDEQLAASCSDMTTFLAGGTRTLDTARDVAARVTAQDSALRETGRRLVVASSEVTLHAPVPKPRRIRDYFTYRQHATGAGVSLPESFTAAPACYQCNADSVIGPGDTIPWPPYTQQLDYELEVGFFVGEGGRDIPAGKAQRHIAGVTLFNDVSARDIQFFEMAMKIGPSKGKDFCNVLGPCVVTMDEVDEFGIDVTARVNGEVWSQGRTSDRQFSFAEMLAWASYGEDVFPGEFLAAGTVPGGCGLELDRWLQPGDVVEFEATGLGVLRNPVGQHQAAPEGAGLPSFQGAPAYHVPAH